MMNPIALMLILTGVFLFLGGIMLFRGNKKPVGAMLLILGLAAAAFPFAVSYFLGR